MRMRWWVSMIAVVLCLGMPACSDSGDQSPSAPPAPPPPTNPPPPQPDLSEICDVGLCRQLPAAKASCIDTADTCLTLGLDDDEDCIALGLLSCNAT